MAGKYEGAQIMALQKDILAFMRESPEKLFNVVDIMDRFGVDLTASQNGLYNLHVKGMIKKHKDQITLESGKKSQQYALELDEDLCVYYQKSSITRTYTKRGTAKKAKKNDLPSAKEVRGMFAQTQNTMAKMEDMIIAVVEQYEELEKMLNKIKNITS